MTASPDHMALLLESVHAALTQADYGALDSLTPQIEAELARLEASRDRAALIRLRAQAARNAACLMAAQRGLRAARHRVEEIRRARSGLVTYGPSGARTAPTAAGVLTRRF